MSELRKTKFCIVTLLAFLSICTMMCCTQMQMYLEEDYAKMRKLYNVSVGRANQNMNADFLSASYIVYYDEDENKKRLSDKDAKRILYILSQAKYLPKKDFKLWYEAKTRAERTSPFFHRYHWFLFYSQDGELLFQTSIWSLGFIPESRIDEYLMSPTLSIDHYLPDALHKELEELTAKYVIY